MRIDAYLACIVFVEQVYVVDCRISILRPSVRRSAARTRTLPPTIGIVLRSESWIGLKRNVTARSRTNLIVNPLQEIPGIDGAGTTGAF